MIKNIIINSYLDEEKHLITCKFPNKSHNSIMVLYLFCMVLGLKKDINLLKIIIYKGFHFIYQNRLIIIFMQINDVLR